MCIMAHLNLITENAVFTIYSTNSHRFASSLSLIFCVNLTLSTKIYAVNSITGIALIQKYFLTMKTRGKNQRNTVECNAPILLILNSQLHLFSQSCHHFTEQLMANSIFALTLVKLEANKESDYLTFMSCQYC